MRTLVFIFIIISSLAVGARQPLRTPSADGKLIAAKVAPIAAPAAPSTQSVELPPPAPAAILSFLEWKSMRVTEAQQRLEQFLKGQALPGDERSTEQHLKFNVDVALQLGVQDYFSIYMKNLEAEDFKEATRKLTQEEAAELLIAYRNSLENNKKSLPKFTKSPKPNAPGKNPSL